MEAAFLDERLSGGVGSGGVGSGGVGSGLSAVISIEFLFSLQTNRRRRHKWRYK